MRNLFLPLVFALTACSNPGPTTSTSSTAGFPPLESSTTAIAPTKDLAFDRWIPSRGTKIPITLTTPNDATTPSPLVVMLHGHGGSRHEAGGFTQVAKRLAGAGIASVRMDFPGCGDSNEPFRNNTLTNMLADARAARNYAIENAAIDTTRMALMGYSMGGRLAIALADEDERFQTLALWAPSVAPGTTGLVDFLGGPDALAKARATASVEGFAPFTTTWGQQQELSADWFAEMEASRPLQTIANYEGSIFVLYGDKDTVVPPAEAQSVVSAAKLSHHARFFAVADADHGLGLFSEEPELTQIAVTKTVAALISELQ